VANARVVVHPEGLRALLIKNPEVVGLLKSQGMIVESEAASTAQDAQNGPGGTIFGYAEAGFTTEWKVRGKRPQVVVRSNASSEMATRVHFYTQKVWGVAHMRKALKAIT
jgi:hypothetical protein